MSLKTLNIKHSNNFGLGSKIEKHGILSAVTRTVLTWQERATTRHHLVNLSQENLTDIGLSHADVMAEAKKPFWQN